MSPLREAPAERVESLKQEHGDLVWDLDSNPPDVTDAVGEFIQTLDYKKSKELLELLDNVPPKRPENSERVHELEEAFVRLFERLQHPLPTDPRKRADFFEGIFDSVRREHHVKMIEDHDGENPVEVHIAEEKRFQEYRDNIHNGLLLTVCKTLEPLLLKHLQRSEPKGLRHLLLVQSNWSLADAFDKYYKRTLLLSDVDSYVQEMKKGMKKGRVVEFEHFPPPSNSIGRLTGDLIFMDRLFANSRSDSVDIPTAEYFANKILSDGLLIIAQRATTPLLPSPTMMHAGGLRDSLPTLDPVRRFFERQGMDFDLLQPMLIVKAATPSGKRHLRQLIASETSDTARHDHHREIDGLVQRTEHYDHSFVYPMNIFVGYQNPAHAPDVIPVMRNFSLGKDEVSDHQPKPMSNGHRSPTVEAPVVEKFSMKGLQRTAKNLFQFVTYVLESSNGGFDEHVIKKLLSDEGAGLVLSEFNALRGSEFNRLSAAAEDPARADIMFTIFPQRKRIDRDEKKTKRRIRGIFRDDLPEPEGRDDDEQEPEPDNTETGAEGPVTPASAPVSGMHSSFERMKSLLGNGSLASPTHKTSPEAMKQGLARMRALLDQE